MFSEQRQESELSIFAVRQTQVSTRRGDSPSSRFSFHVSRFTFHVSSSPQTSSAPPAAPQKTSPDRPAHPPSLRSNDAPAPRYPAAVIPHRSQTMKKTATTSHAAF